MKTICVSGKSVTFGRKRPRPGRRCLHLRNYLRASLPSPPSSVNYSEKASQELSNINMNDSLGDCVIAGGYHIVGIETGNASNEFIATNAQIIADYSAIGGYVPGYPSTDNGCDEPTALDYWTTHGFANGTKLLGWLAVDATNKTEVMQAMWLFENLFLGIELPNGWISPFPSNNGFTWDVAGNPDPNNGHCVISAGYGTAGLNIDTWGLLGTLTWNALAEYCIPQNNGELYVMLTPDQLSAGQTLAPNGVSWSDLIGDFDALGGKVPVPTPPAPTPPTPPAPTGITLAQAIQWAQAGIAKSPYFLTRPHVESLVKQTLTSNWPKT